MGGRGRDGAKSQATQDTELALSYWGRLRVAPLFLPLWFQNIVYVVDTVYLETWGQMLEARRSVLITSLSEHLA